MPTDTKRLAVPEKTIPYQFYLPAKKIPANPLNGKNLRQDGRQAEEMRPIFIKTKVVTRAKGSVYLESGDTKVMCSVFGPREVSKREDFSMTGAICVEFKFATFSETCRRGHQQDGQERDLSLLLQETLQPAILLHTFPKCQVDISITVLENGGSALSTAITAASIALVDAGVEMYDVVIGAAVLFCPRDESEESQTQMKKIDSIALVDPSSSEESLLSSPSSNHGLLVVGYMPSLDQIAGFHQSGTTSIDVFHAGVQTCVATAKKALPLVKRKIAESEGMLTKDSLELAARLARKPEAASRSIVDSV